MTSNRTRRNVALLAACQAMLFTNNSTLIAINGLAGLALSPYKALATLPVAAGCSAARSRRCRHRST